MNFQFGVEIEAVLQPNDFHYYTEITSSGQAYYRDQLAEALRNWGLMAISHPPNDPRKNFPEHYNKWFITKDRSLNKPLGCSMLALHACLTVFSNCLSDLKQILKPSLRF
jgi:hypothetical protein